MTIKEVKRAFKAMYADFIHENWDDPMMLNLEYGYYLDSLCKDGQITPRSYHNAGNLVYREHGKTKYC